MQWNTLGADSGRHQPRLHRDLQRNHLCHLKIFWYTEEDTGCMAGVGCLGFSSLDCINGCPVGKKLALRCCPTASPDVEVGAPGDPDAIPGVVSAPVAADLSSVGKEV